MGETLVEKKELTEGEKLFEPGQIVARVGNQPILAGDLLGSVNQMLEPYADEAPKEELEKQRKVLMRQMLHRTIESKLIYLAFLRSGIPPERLPEIQGKLFKSFDENRLEDTMKRADVSSPGELDAKLRKYGSSLDKQRRAYAEQVLSRQMLRRAVNYEPEITHDQILAYYRQEADVYRIDATVKWEHLMTRFDKFSSKREAWQALAAMGNEVLRGAPLAAVAKRSSQGGNAPDGGQHDSTTQGSLVYEDVDDALFQIEPGKLSQIIESEQGFHIVRVIERQDESRVDFTEAQVEIKETLRQEIVQEELAKYIDGLKAKTTIWTIYDEPQTADKSERRR